MSRLAVLLACALVASVSAASIPLEDRAVKIPTDNRIIGGSETHISKYPSTAELLMKGCSTCGFAHRCGGSFLNSKMVLTAAHCVYSVDANKLHVAAGVNEREGPGVIVPVVKVIVHEDYNSGVQYNNDIALLILGAEVPLNNFDIKTVELASTPPSGGELATVVGWGTTVEGSNPADFLMEVDVNIIPNGVCDDNYGGGGRIRDSMLCAGVPEGGKDACQGDSGGPLFVNGFLTGIVSWGSGCARPTHPGVYASVPHLKEWIENEISSNL